jgi:hypothetical protein
MIFHNVWKKIEFDIKTVIIGDYAAASCMICFGAVLGKADLFQMWLLVTF